MGITGEELKEYKKRNRVKVGFKQRLSECSYFGLGTILVCCLMTVLLGALVHYGLKMYALYTIKNIMLEALSQSYTLYIFILGSLFSYMAVIAWMFSRDTGDTVIIEVIKKVGKGKGYHLLSTDSYLIGLKDIEFYLQNTDKKEVCVTPVSIGNLEGINQNRYGYVYFKTIGDFCFSNDLKIQVEDRDERSSQYILRVNHYKYSGGKLLNPLYFNEFILQSDDGSVKEYSIDELLARINGEYTGEEYQSEYVNMKNNYIRRLYMADCYDYPEGFWEDLRQGAKSGLNRWLFGVASVSICMTLGLFTFYGDFKTSNFIQDFNYAGDVDGLSIYTDNLELYDEYNVFVVDSLKLLPGNLVEKAASENWSLVFVEDSIYKYGMLSTLVGQGEISGCTFPFYKLIVIKYPEVDASLATSFFVQTILHEMGHYLGLDAKAMTGEWQEIYKEESNTYMTNYARTNYSEGFASTFADYIMFKNALESKSPKTTNYLRKVISTYIPN